MLSCLVYIAVAGSQALLSQEKSDPPVQFQTPGLVFRLGWNKGDVLTYAVTWTWRDELRKGEWIVSVDEADEERCRISWPKIEFGKNRRTFNAGSVWISRFGRVDHEQAERDLDYDAYEVVARYLIQMLLPDKPLRINDRKFTVDISYGEGEKLTVLGKAIDFYTSDGITRFAIYTEQTFPPADGEIHTVFDRKAGVFTSGELEILGNGNKSTFKLVEYKKAERTR